ncbi:hypothetical protein NMY22_g15590 [Coprinellus aureogranulatus]|nr:hypothetical protein NMY22_g15590 [Coprinellus aureogranulatus]
MPTRGQSLYLVYLLVTQGLLCVFPLVYLSPNPIATTSGHHYLLVIGDRTGVVSMANFVALFLFASRNNILLWITNWRHSTFLLLHRWIGYCLILEVAGHSILMYLLHLLYLQDHDTRSKRPPWICGMIATLAFALILPASMLPIRKRIYEFFLITHRVLAIVALLATFLHTNYLFGFTWGYEIWIYVGGGLWFLDRTLRVVRIASNGYRTARVSVIDEEGECVRVDIDGIAAEGHVYLYFPTLSWRFWENHPFSVLSSFSGGTTARPSDRDNALDLRRASHMTNWGELNRPAAVYPRTTLLVRGVNGFTKTLVGRLLESPNHRLSLPVLIESNYHANPGIRNLSHCSSLLCIAGGVGITAVIPLIKSFGGVRSRLEWGLRSEALALALQRDLTSLTQGTGIVEVNTSVGKRLNVKEIVKEELERGDDIGDLGVVVCGPLPMADDVRNAVAEFGSKAKRGVVFVDESFIEDMQWIFSPRAPKLFTTIDPRSGNLSESPEYPSRPKHLSLKIPSNACNTTWPYHRPRNPRKFIIILEKYGFELASPSTLLTLDVYQVVLHRAFYPTLRHFVFVVSLVFLVQGATGAAVEGSPSQPAPSPVVPLGGQCGGLTYKGPTGCEQAKGQPPAVCIVVDPYLHQCQIAGTTTVTITSTHPHPSSSATCLTSTLACSASCKIACPTGQHLTGTSCPFCECAEPTPLCSATPSEPTSTVTVTSTHPHPGTPTFTHPHTPGEPTFTQPHPTTPTSTHPHPTTPTFTHPHTPGEPTFTHPHPTTTPTITTITVTPPTTTPTFPPTITPVPTGPPTDATTCVESTIACSTVCAIGCPSGMVVTATVTGSDGSTTVTTIIHPNPSTSIPPTTFTPPPTQAPPTPTAIPGSPPPKPTTSTGSSCVSTKVWCATVWPVDCEEGLTLTGSRCPFSECAKPTPLCSTWSSSTGIPSPTITPPF